MALCFHFVQRVSSEDYLACIHNRMVSAASSPKTGLNLPDSGMNWLMFELLWRDFFRYHIEQILL